MGRSARQGQITAMAKHEAIITRNHPPPNQEPKIRISKTKITFDLIALIKAIIIGRIHPKTLNLSKKNLFVPLFETDAHSTKTPYISFLLLLLLNAPGFASARFIPDSIYN